MSCGTRNNMPSTQSLFRTQPLAFALAVALALPFASDASFASAPGNASSLRPDGSVLWSVDNCNDSGAGSLRDIAAHANHGDGIDLGSLSCSTISVTSGAITLHDVELTGPGAGHLEINGTGNQNHRIFNHSSAGGTLAISGVTISGGIYASNGGLGGGCLRSVGGNLRITDSVFRSCLVLTPVGQAGNARGGAIALYGTGNVGLYGTTLASNIARTDHEFADGGALYTQGSVTMRRSTISNNSVSAINDSSASTQGGGLFSGGSVSIEDSTLDGNSATHDAGAALVKGGGTLLRSTVSNNYAGAGTAGIVMIGHFNTTAGIYNSTISGNVSAQSTQLLSGGLYLGTATAEITNCTVTGNSETNQVGTKFGAGIVFGNYVSSVSLSGTIVSGNFFDDGEPPYASDDMDGPASAAFAGDSNLIGWSHLLPVPTDTIWNSEPGLGPLQDNGGPTRTHMPLSNSPVVDASDAHGYDTDQRGYARIIGVAADIGSVEYDDMIFANGFDPFDPN